jgi:hypothetical protein
LSPEEFIVEKRSEVYVSFMSKTTVQSTNEPAAEEESVVVNTSSARVARVMHADVVGDCMGAVIISTAFRTEPTLLQQQQQHTLVVEAPVIQSNQDWEMSQELNMEEAVMAHTMVDNEDIAATMVDEGDRQQQEPMDYFEESESNTAPQQPPLLAEVVAGIENAKMLLGQYKLTINNAVMTQKERYAVREDILNAWHHSHELTSSLYELSSLFRKV